MVRFCLLGLSSRNCKREVGGAGVPMLLAQPAEGVAVSPLLLASPRQPCSSALRRPPLGGWFSSSWLSVVCILDFRNLDYSAHNFGKSVWLSLSPHYFKCNFIFKTSINTQLAEAACFSKVPHICQIRSSPQLIHVARLS